MRDFVEHHIGAKQEIAAVPEKTLRNVGAGLFSIRLFDESLDGKCCAAVELRSWTYVAVAGRGIGRRDAERDDRAGGSGFGSLPAGVFQRLGIAHDVIGGKDEYACARPPPGRQLRRDGDCHGGIAARRLQHHVGFNIALAQLLGSNKTKIGMSDDDRPIK